jgi:TonB family protein
MPGSPRSALLSALIHVAAILLIVVATRVTQAPQPPQRPASFVSLNIGRYLPRVASTGRGGGGAREKTAASKGILPRVARRQFTPPMVVVRNQDPLLAIEPTLVANAESVLPAIHLPYGDPNGVAGPPSGGRGGPGGIGDGCCGGVGNDQGPGYGHDGTDGVSGVGSIKGSLIPPIVLRKIEPEYSDEARRARIQGVVVLSIEVDEQGQVRNMRVVRSLGLGLDERAMEAVGHWKFRAGTINGKAIVTSALVEVNFRLL